MLRRQIAVETYSNLAVEILLAHKVILVTNWQVSNADILSVTTDGLICSANPSLNLSGASIRCEETASLWLHQPDRMLGRPAAAVRRFINDRLLRAKTDSWMISWAQ